MGRIELAVADNAPGEFSGDFDPSSTLYQIPGSEFTSLYMQLGGTNNSGLPTIGPFSNLDSENWYTVNGEGAPYTFDTGAGWQYTGDGFIAMAVRSGTLVDANAAVPEPSTFLLLGAGLGGLALKRRKSRK